MELERAFGSTITIIGSYGQEETTRTERCEMNGFITPGVEGFWNEKTAFDITADFFP